MGQRDLPVVDFLWRSMGGARPVAVVFQCFSFLLVLMLRNELE